ncbi:MULTISPECIES: MarR family transcriptional regulator [unclassified Paenibacillus]|uniref:MarR family winged helix-turn-helix transcriptional regulator n=1 Tax=unclassified Paenibacillus TaxID=185978 RepID=UPI0024075144|nr:MULTISPECIES: MarR family transcriptional regulator [unclassified Paenibacillus]MDF9844830.1 DNA-binding MarR family transcriptional regulator [Paenibacillus sp. PastF-2]MDF9851431.1 DNA-binding MarR family transcriptional regulator [Paenibacillus sp. PastM-2]MDF9858039.1 DNA-binding MarR family transcriptional regulator [Paenibacillus sp. PastF-1]MDH6483307.1 DNA-binding MarR family transcriptional regulator [Paenibacillus sp. PastH-2]MDH6510716.1 DNA-binding MarR family transcriptional re
MHSSEFSKIWHKILKDYKLHMDSNLAPTLTDAQLTVLELLQERDAMKPSDLAPHLATSPAAVTMLLDRMEKNGLIVRERDAADRRIVWVSITEVGRKEAARGLKVRSDFFAEALNPISSHNQQLLLYLMGKMAVAPAPESMTP